MKHFLSVVVGLFLGGSLSLVFAQSFDVRPYEIATSTQSVLGIDVSLVDATRYENERAVLDELREIRKLLLTIALRI